MIELKKLPKTRGNVEMRYAQGHFATNHSHINYYIDITYPKTRLSEAKETARELVSRFSKGKSRFGASELARKMRWQGENAFVKVKLIADILCETKLIDFTVRRDPGDDIYLFRIIPAKGKTNLDKSGLYNRIRAAQYD